MTCVVGDRKSQYNQGSVKNPHFAAILLGLALFQGACATSRSTPSTRQGDSQPAAGLDPRLTETEPPQLPESATQGPEPLPLAEQAVGPEPARVRTITVVLAPGLARSFAGAGVLIALEQNRIPVRAVVATETSAVIAALFSGSTSVGDFEFKLLKLKEEVFKSSGLMIGLLGRTNDGAEVETLLDQILGGKQVKDARVTPKIFMKAENSTQITLWTEGRLSRGARSAMGVPGFMRNVREGGVEFGSAATVDALNLSEARAVAGGGPVLVVDVTTGVGSGEKLSAELAVYVTEMSRRVSAEGRAADLVLKPEMKGLEYLDFSKRSEALFRGKQVVIKNLKEIKRLVASESAR
jgi:predicted acylesterase/phospholipase RssA